MSAEKKLKQQLIRARRINKSPTPRVKEIIQFRPVGLKEGKTLTTRNEENREKKKRENRWERKKF